MKNLQSIMKLPDWRSNYPAFAWCADHGSGWYLPAIDELKELLLKIAAYDKINAAFSNMKSEIMRPPKSYWSSTEYNERCACSVRFLRIGVKNLLLNSFLLKTFLLLWQTYISML